ncbi:hypothetical protein G6F50_017809 [Rhizopus delemar]|uniref:Uncharacterized protein n=1 Tax=Rhizopus delemar TaxID=936053 RepID=A0A9P6XPN2_9FUNG|nr:hypothetical protein G6F50_017809 [Rhizopus delemar]
MEPGPEPVAALDAAKLGLTGGQETVWPNTFFFKPVYERRASPPGQSQCRRQHGPRPADAARGCRLFAAPRAPLVGLHLPRPAGRLGRQRQPAGAGLQL